MPRWLVAISAGLLLVGCHRTTKDRLQGRWLGDRIENVPAAQLTKANGWVKGAALEFSGPKVTVTIPAETPRTGSFKIARNEADRVVVSFQRDEGGSDEAEFRFVDDHTMRWMLGSGACRSEGSTAGACTGAEIVLVRAAD